LVPLGAMPYIFAASFLSIASREINEKSLKNAVRSVGITANDKFIKDVIALSLGEGNLIYAHAYYLLLACGIDPDEDKIIKIVESQGIAADRKSAAYTIAFIRASAIK